MFCYNFFDLQIILLNYVNERCVLSIITKVVDGFRSFTGGFHPGAGCKVDVSEGKVVIRSSRLAKKALRSKRGVKKSISRKTITRKKVSAATVKREVIEPASKIGISPHPRKKRRVADVDQKTARVASKKEVLPRPRKKRRAASDAHKLFRLVASGSISCRADLSRLEEDMLSASSVTSVVEDDTMVVEPKACDEEETPKLSLSRRRLTRKRLDSLMTIGEVPRFSVEAWRISPEACGMEALRVLWDRVAVWDEAFGVSAMTDFFETYGSAEIGGLYSSRIRVTTRTWQKMLEANYPEVQAMAAKTIAGLVEKGVSLEEIFNMVLGYYTMNGTAFDSLSRRVVIRKINEVVNSGVFSATDIPAKSFVGVYTGQLRRLTSVKDPSYAMHICNDEIGDFFKPWVIDAFDEGNFTSIFNHSEDSSACNLERHLLLIPSFDPSRLSLLCLNVFMTKRPIRSGEQLCFDYDVDDAKYWGGHKLSRAVFKMEDSGSGRLRVVKEP